MISVQTSDSKSIEESETFKVQQKVFCNGDKEIFDLKQILIATLGSHLLNPIYGISFEYWSSTSQTYISCGILDSNAGQNTLIKVDDLINY